ncbi:transferrin-binding protein-like solute binding protein [Stakelama tenebrarum]|uniref:Transferrin-binding protein-like solute binding protein n=1 Tax=Stakelama tenebrarum TaxID=2711215 RepID=A0A6G6Y916_9SPHN|nr:transferrin-binding protein-like solute binding protein [Sphingosinithalassobacter tenebrarum]QIG81297.1 transferrin-binding protein-like solute binding protein [Sphingosinithalassobacter tenebrarum]
MKRGFLVAASAAALLSACSGGNSGSSSGGGSVVTPPVTPSPSPTSSYPLYADLSGQVRLQSAQSGFWNIHGPSVPQIYGVNGFGEGIEFEYDADAKTYVIDNGAYSGTFTADEIDPASPQDSAFYRKTDGSFFNVRQPNGSDPFHYLRFIDYVVASDSGSHILALTGIPTRTADLPTSGSYSYQGAAGVFGYAVVATGTGDFETYSLSNSTIRMTVNFGAETVSAHIVFVGTPESGGADIDLVTADVSANFDGSNARAALSGTFRNSNLPLAIGGVVFGSQAQEAGAILSLSAGSNETPARYMTLVAMGAAKR